MKIRTRLVIAFLACGLGPLTIASVLSYRTGSNGLTKVEQQGEDSLEQSAFNQLVALRDVKANQIERYFAERRGDMNVLVDNVATLRNEAFQKLAAVQDIKKDGVRRLLNTMRRDVEMLADSEDALASYEAFKGYHDATRAAAMGPLDVTTAEYEAVYDQWYPTMEKYVHRAGYYDVFLICAKHGHVLFTEAKEGDLGANLAHGPLKEEGLGRAWRQVVETADTAMVDFSAYSPSNGEQAAFMASPVRDEGGDVVAVVALQMPVTPINAIVQSREGLGETGETYLVGSEGGKTAFRSDLMTMGEGAYVVGKEIHTAYIDRAIHERRSFEDVFTDSSGKLVLIAADPIEVDGLNWACITKIDLEEAVAPHIEGQTEDFFTKYANQYGYYDLFLISPAGNCFYSVAQEADYQTNLVDGKFKDSNLGALVREVLSAKRFGFADFSPYAPSNGEPAAFIAQAVLHNGDVEMIVALQLPLDAINAVMGVRAGMGETGETYLVGPDLLMRSDSYLDPESHSVNASFANPQTGRVQTDATEAALAGETDARLITDYNGNPVLSAFAPIEVFDTTWALMAEIDQSEAFAAVDTMQATADRSSASLIAWSGGVAIAAIVGVAIAALLIASLIARPIRAMVDRLKDIAEGEGDLTQRVDENRKDELGELGKWFNKFVDRVHDIIAEVMGSARDVASASTQIAASSEEMSTGMTEQSEQVRQIAAAIEEMSASITEVAQKSKDAADKAETSGQTAARGGEVVKQTVTGMNSISDAVSASAASVRALGQRGEQIGQVIDVINDIADQTNLLALNAAIEAARAGEHGRGFAVVADEVRQLADRTTKATEEVAESITAIQNETQQAVGRMESGTQEVQEGVELAGQAGDSLREIVGGAKDVASVVQSIAAAAEQQASASEEVSRNVESITAVTQQATESASQSAAASAQLSAKAESLQQLLGAFKLKAGA